MKLFLIDTSYACFAIGVQDSKVIEAAPIAHWTIGKSFEFVIEYYKTQKKGKIIEVDTKARSNESCYNS